MPNLDDIHVILKFPRLIREFKSLGIFSEICNRVFAYCENFLDCENSLDLKIRQWIFFNFSKIFLVENRWLTKKNEKNFPGESECIRKELLGSTKDEDWRRRFRSDWGTAMLSSMMKEPTKRPEILLPFRELNWKLLLRELVCEHSGWIGNVRL